MTRFILRRMCPVFLSLTIMISLSGCDNIRSFLAEYFPTLKKEAEAPDSVQPAPARKESSGRPLGPDTLARVGSWTITVDEFNRRLKNIQDLVPDFDPNNAEAKRMILEELINQQLLVLHAEAEGIADQEDIKEAVEESRRNLLVREMADRITMDIEATPEEVRGYYDQNREAFSAPTEFHLREIVVPTQEEANQILVELLKGADFATVARDNSKGETASQGGDLGWRSEPKFPAMAGQLSVLNPGDLSGVFRGPDGFYIIKLEDSRGGEPVAFEDVRADIREGLTLLKQQQALAEHLNRLREKFPVKTNEDLF